MARSNALYRLAEERGITREALVKEAIEEHGTIRSAASALGVTPLTISRFLRVGGLRIKPKRIVTVERINDRDPQ